METVKCNVDGIDYMVDLESLSFSWSIEQDPEEGRVLVLRWERLSQFINIKWVRYITLRPRPPWATNFAGIITDPGS